MSSRFRCGDDRHSHRKRSWMSRKQLFKESTISRRSLEQMPV
ncbi:hypothetical protein KKY_1681 [Pelagibacterium halotolerans B2]|uniref:Uncharacterized protein n=1 Tax=Pelagibacterium halotolerans (strain DSM 22347 / JCM 15775 / CGMCC 1.7692 / B2) TaxID=1082931 RepID=G4RC49_PELHB|nr:hypothetical protein KKY_1681 [Pelagibacterium halotolerans B2]